MRARNPNSDVVKTKTLTRSCQNFNYIFVFSIDTGQPNCFL